MVFLGFFFVCGGREMRCVSSQKKLLGLLGKKKKTKHLGIKGKGRFWHHFGANWSSRQEMKGLEGEKKQRESFSNVMVVVI